MTGPDLVPAPDERCAQDLFESRSRAHPDAVALDCQGEQVTYGRLSQRSNQLAHELRSIGVGPNVAVALAMERSIDYAVAVLGTLKAGGACMPLDLGYPPDRLAFMVQDARVGAVVLRHKGRDVLRPSQAPLVCLESEPERLARHPVEAAAPVNTPTDTAYLIYTSGSTGRPKGVAMPHAPLVNLVEWQRRESGADSAHRTLQFAPLGFDVSFQELFGTWVGGGTLVVVPEHVRRDFRALLRFVVEERIQRMFVPPVVLHGIAEVSEECGLVPSDLREVNVAGEALRITPPIRRLFRRIGSCDLVNQYGPSESHVVTAHRLEGAPEDWPSLPPIGRPISRARIYILDAQRKPAAVGEPGELHIGGDVLAAGYIGRADLTADRFVPDPFAGVPHARMYRSGDLCRWRSDGALDYLGRMDDQVKVDGYRVEPAEVAACLEEHEAVAQAVVVPRKTSRESTQLVAYVVPRHTATVSGLEPDLRRHAAGRLARFMVPAHVIVVPSIPLTANGKIAASELPPPSPTRAASESDAPTTPTESMLLPLWREVIGNPSIGVNDDFFTSGGNSLLAMRLLVRLERELGMQVSGRDLIVSSSVRGLARYLSGPPAASSELPPGVVRIKEGDERAPVFCVPGLGSVAFGFRFLAERMRTTRTLLAVEVHDLETVPEDLETIHGTALAVARAIRRAQPAGPYSLVGYSYGGLVAYEVARRLAAEGERVSPLVIVDEPAPGASRPNGVLRRAMKHVREVARLGPVGGYDYIAMRARRRLGGDETEDPPIVPKERANETQLERRLRETSERCLRAFQGYRGTNYHGDMTVIRATGEDEHVEIDDPSGTLGWAAFCSGRIGLLRLSCRHLELFEDPHVTEFACRIDALVQ